jgi:hypothetical protein
MNCGGLPLYVLRLKIGAPPVMLLRNLDPIYLNTSIKNVGSCTGTELSRNAHFTDVVAGLRP